MVLIKPRLSCAQCQLGNGKNGVVEIKSRKQLRAIESVKHLNIKMEVFGFKLNQVFLVYDDQLIVKNLRGI